MPLIYLDGPERAGKSTLAEALRVQYGARVRHWGPVTPDDRVYGPAMLEDIESGELVVWDRGWAAEHVYSRLLGRDDRRLHDDPWLGEWIHGRALSTIGVGCILLGPSVDTLSALRGEGDLPVDVDQEREAFREYGKRFGYLVIKNHHEADELDRWAWTLKEEARVSGFRARVVGVTPPWYAGPADARVVFVGEKHAKHQVIAGSWLPLTGKYGAVLGRDLGDFALECGWVNMADCPPQVLRRFELVVALGDVATRWVTSYVKPKRMISMFHPAYIYRWGKQDERLTAHREQLNSIAEEFVR